MSGLPVYLRLLGMAGAGIAAFYSTAHWSTSQRVARSELAEVVTPAERSASQPAAAPVAAAASSAEGGESLALGDRSRSIPRSTGALFASQSWLPPPPPPTPPPPPPPPPKPAPPAAPPLPFSFVGMLEQGTDKPAAFLAKGDALLVVSVGDLLDNKTYRVDTLSPNEIVMTYLPLNIQQTLRVPGGTR